MKHKKNNGFSLVETIVYTAILAVTTIFVVNSLLKTVSAFNSFRVSKQINAAAINSMERMTREIKSSSQIDTNNSVFDINPGKLIINKNDPGTGAPITLEFSVANSRLTIKKDNESPIALTSSGTEVSNLVFRQVATSTDLHSKAIKIELTIKSGYGNYQKTENFYDTVVLRGSYK
ncbi:MAG: type II secretion system protein [bacterium]|nr:type II secretion system protein [bacterium]